MICTIKHNGFFVIRNSKGKFYSLPEKGKPCFTASLSAAYRWTRQDRATKYLQICLNNNPDYQVVLMEDQNKRINKYLIDYADQTLQEDIKYYNIDNWIEHLSDATDGFTDINPLLAYAENRKEQIEKTILDLRHYIEFGEFNAYQGYKLFSLMQNLYRQRRSYKDIIYMMENISENTNSINYIYWLAIQLKNRGYKPKQLKTMFNERV